MELRFIFVTSVLGLISTRYCTDGKAWPPPPSFLFKAKMCRYLMHNADWGIISSYSPKFKQPFGTLASFADGPLQNSSGIPYFYLANISTTWQNIAFNRTVSFTLSEAMGDQCEKFNLDPEEPTCARLMVTGDIVEISNHEAVFAKKALFSRHPAMERWPTSHGWNFCKLKLSGVYLLDFYGGMKHVSLQDYFNAGYKDDFLNNRRHSMIVVPLHVNGVCATEVKNLTNISRTKMEYKTLHDSNYSVAVLERGL